jgi:hypothetical protein
VQVQVQTQQCRRRYRRAWGGGEDGEEAGVLRGEGGAVLTFTNPNLDTEDAAEGRRAGRRAWKVLGGGHKAAGGVIDADAAVVQQR